MKKLEALLLIQSEKRCTHKMRPWINWRGLDNRKIPGLMITTLPPIRQPKIRANEETVDGRDGSIITTLGYESYDMPLGVGLYGRYNIDNIISYFSGSGYLIKSDEPDKKYICQIIEGADYEKLIRFRTAEITLRTQPFKYAVDNIKTYTMDSGSVQVRNYGNYKSKPKITFYGNGSVDVLINGVKTSTITIDGNITLDSKEQECTKDGELANRNMTGYFPELLPGKNIIQVTDGTITKIVIQDASRWL